MLAMTLFYTLTVPGVRLISVVVMKQLKKKTYGTVGTKSLWQKYFELKKKRVGIVLYSLFLIFN